MELVLAIDGGGSGCRAVLADPLGRVLAQATGGPANIASDLPGAVGNLLAVAGKVLQGAAPGRCHAVLGLAGGTVADRVAALRAAMQAALPLASLRIETDARIAVAGALRAEDGIVAALGTGSVFARQLAGQVQVIGGRGLVIGDEASGAWLGRGLVSAAVRAADGLGAVTPVLAGVLDELGGIDGAVAFSLQARPADFARFAPRVMDAPDPAARVLLAQAEADIAAYVAALQTGALPVVFLGSLGLALAPRFSDRWVVRNTAGSGLDGAVWLGLQALTAG